MGSSRGSGANRRFLCGAWLTVSIWTILPGCRRDDPVMAAPPCAGFVSWPIPEDDSLFLGPGHGSTDQVCFRESDDFFTAEDWFCIYARWTSIGGNPDGWSEDAYISGGDSIGFIRPVTNTSCYDKWRLGDTIPVFGDLVGFADLLLTYQAFCLFDEGESYVAFVQIVDGRKHAGYIKLRKWYSNGNTWKVLLVHRSLCPNQDLVIAE